ncbi:hypothetical protein [Pararhodonellum marinum]|uniref:hypothetical protein n=1 Tax=Pararhodonellum marinum TaxID=2755358 RepID=UPI00188FFC7C|nr:hypothetical protein [Pararhodonellum marinum]
MKPNFYYSLLFILVLFSVGCMSEKDDMESDVLFSVLQENDGITILQFNNVTLEKQDDNPFAIIYSKPYEFDAIPQFGRRLRNDEMTLVYMQWYESSSGPVWRPIPISTFATPETSINYTTETSRRRVTFFLETIGDPTGFDIDNEPVLWDDLVYRVLVIPTDNFINVPGRMDFSDYDAVVKYFGITEENTVEIDY